MINTVTGPITNQDLGKTLMHEHIQFGYPGYQGDVTLGAWNKDDAMACLLYTSPSPRDKRQSRMPSSA